ncbi:MAG: hypothetical protein IJC93_01535 [Clostridia bacterium]|nr:hypothetical protein [Clostridia bacterium]
MVFKRFLSVILCAVMLLGIAVPMAAAETSTITVDPINIEVGGKVFLPTDVTGKNVPVFAYQGTTYAPLRALAEAYGLTVGYNQEQNLASVDGSPSADYVGTKGTARVLTERTTLSVVPIRIEVNGEVFQPRDVTGKIVPVFAYQGTTYAPLRALAEAYGLRVDYDRERNLATVDFTAASVLTEEVDRQLRSDLQKRIDEILATETEIVRSDVFIPGETYTGTAYYISNDGDDDNDGLTPETAWQSVGKLLQELDQREGSVMKPGDAIFLRRGDIFRLSHWNLSVSLDNVTISAYGEGEKPILTTSSENGSGEEKWELVYEDDTGKKIWKFYRDMRDTSMVVLDNGEAITRRVYEFYTEDGYISCTDSGWWMHEDWSDPDTGVKLLDRLLPLEESMMEDLNLISRPVRSDPNSNYGESGKGPLYLRCDSGNPGALYDSIEFSEFEVCATVWLGASGVVFDNLSFRSTGTAWIKAQHGSPWWEVENTLIQNCEFAHGGGCATYYVTTPEGTRIIEAQGDGIYGIIQNATIRHNYFHDAMSGTTTYEWPMEDPNTAEGFYHVLDNVMVNTMGMRMDSTSNALQHLDSHIIRGNHIWNTGRMDRGSILYTEAPILVQPNYYKEWIIEDNVIYGTENGYESNALLALCFNEHEGNTIPVIRNNTYVQYSGRNFGYFNMWRPDHFWSIDEPKLLIKVAEMIGDTTSKFYVIR